MEVSRGPRLVVSGLGLMLLGYGFWELRSEPQSRDQLGAQPQLEGYMAYITQSHTVEGLRV